jgi:hypothetical protein
MNHDAIPEAQFFAKLEGQATVTCFVVPQIAHSENIGKSATQTAFIGTPLLKQLL